MNTHHDRRHAMAFRAPLLCLSALIALTACSSTGGKPRETGGGMVAGQADTPRFTVAMVTHGPPGDTFWDLIRKGAETAAAKDNIELKYSAELQGPEQANLVQNAVDSKVDAIAVTLARPEALASSVKVAIDAGIPVVALNAGIDAWKTARRQRRTSGRTRRSPAKPQASVWPPTEPRRSCASSRTRATSRSKRVALE